MNLTTVRLHYSEENALPFSSVDEFIAEYNRRNPNGHYFDPEMLALYGEERTNMRLSTMVYHICTQCPDVYVFTSTYSCKQCQGCGEGEYYALIKITNKYLSPVSIVPQRQVVFFDAETLKPTTYAHIIDEQPHVIESILRCATTIM